MRCEEMESKTDLERYLEESLPAVANIDRGCPLCVTDYIEAVNPILEKMGCRYRYYLKGGLSGYPKRDLVLEGTEETMDETPIIMSEEEYGQWAQKRIDALEAENKRLLEELDELIARHKGDDCPHAELEAVAYAAREYMEAPPCVYYHYPDHENPRCPCCAARRKLRTALVAAGYMEDE